MDANDFIGRNLTMKRIGIGVLTGLLIASVFAGQSFSQHTITKWPANKPAIVSITFDDGYQSQIDLAELVNDFETPLIRI
jgi:hypothetical protein